MKKNTLKYFLLQEGKLAGHMLSVLMNELLFYLLLLRKNFRQKYKAESGIRRGVLLLRFSHIGDFVLWLDIAKEFRKLYPNDKITFVCDSYKDVGYLAEQTGYFDHVVVLKLRGFARLKSIFRAMHSKYRIVINADMSRAVWSDLLVLSVGAKERIAPETDLTRMSNRQKKRSDKIYDRIISCDGITEMELVRNAQLIRGLGQKDFLASLPVIKRLQTTPEISALLESIGQKGKNYFAICPGGEVPEKYWPAERFAQVIEYVLQAESNMVCVILGTENEQYVWQKIKKYLVKKGINVSQNCISMLGKTTLTDYIELIRHAKWILSNDTSAGHIAGAVKTPAVVLAQSWDQGRFYPYKLEQSQNTFVPIGILADVPCAGCGTEGIVPQKKYCLKNGVVACIADIQTETVIKILQDKLLFNH